MDFPGKGAGCWKSRVGMGMDPMGSFPWKTGKSCLEKCFPVGFNPINGLGITRMKNIGMKNIGIKKKGKYRDEKYWENIGIQKIGKILG